MHTCGLHRVTTGCSFGCFGQPHDLCSWCSIYARVIQLDPALCVCIVYCWRAYIREDGWLRRTICPLHLIIKSAPGMALKPVLVAYWDSHWGINSSRVERNMLRVVAEAGCDYYDNCKIYFSCVQLG